MHKIIKLLISLVVCTSIVFKGNGQDFVTRDGDKLKFQGSEIKLRGFAFGNLVWEDQFHPSGHHTEEDFKELKDLGMNAVRFYMNYSTFENKDIPFTYKQDGWNWLDSNIVWAKKNSIFLILNMHVPQGGFQSQCGGNDLWDVPSNQTRLAALWKEIAKRYKDEPIIAGYDLLNEPIPTKSVAQWSTLAQRLIDSIRTVDNNHLIITERAIALNCNYSYNDGNFNYPNINEENLMYTVHLYDPHEFTHQNLSWANTGDGGKYPDVNLITPPTDLIYATGNYGNPTLPAGTTDWTFFEGGLYQIEADSMILGRVTFGCGFLGEGTAFYDDLILKEYDENGNFIRDVYKENLSEGSYWFWSQNGDQNAQSISSEGHGDNYSVTSTNTSGPATITLPMTTFKVIKGHFYQVSGWMKGKNIPEGANATITTEFYHSPSGKKSIVRDYEFLKTKILDYSEYVRSKNFPVYFGEFGVARNAFENGKGGEKWVADALMVFDSLGFNWTYHSYKESSFGYYDGWDQPIDRSTVNQPLKETFIKYFAGALSVVDVKPSVNFEISPNPYTETVRIENSYDVSVTAVLYDQFGKLIWTKILQPKSQTSIDGADLISGIYHLNIIKKNEKFSYKLLKMDR